MYRMRACARHAENPQMQAVSGAYLRKGQITLYLQLHPQIHPSLEVRIILVSFGPYIGYRVLEARFDLRRNCVYGIIIYECAILFSVYHGSRATSN